jgi:hypothetical protein
MAVSSLLRERTRPRRRKSAATPSTTGRRGPRLISAAPRTRLQRLGGAQGNEALTRLTAAVLVVLLAAEGITIVQIEGLVRPHMFIGMVLIPPVLLKLGSTAYRFARYYSGSRAYREKGPPVLALRLLAPVLVFATVFVLATGVWLMVIGHGSDAALTLHKASFIVFAGVFALHLAAHTSRVVGSLRSDWRAMLRRSAEGAGARAMLLAASLGGGLALALSLLGLIGRWHGE